MKKLVYILALIVLGACSEDTQSEGTASNKSEKNDEDTLSTEDTLAKDTFEITEIDVEEPYFSMADSVLFAKYHKTRHWHRLEEWCKSASDLTSDKDFKEWIDKGMKLRADLSDEFGGYSEQFEAYEMVSAFEDGGLQEKLMGLIVTCVAECTEIEYTFSPEMMDSIAKLTQGRADDRFTLLWLMAESHTGHFAPYGFKNWFGQTWDYGGSSLVGDSTIYSFLMGYDQYIKDFGYNYSSYLDPLRENAMEMLHTFRSYMFSASKVISELDRIVFEVELSDEEVDKIIKRKEELSDPEANELEVDCEHGGCAYG